MTEIIDRCIGQKYLMHLFFLRFYTGGCCLVVHLIGQNVFVPPIGADRCQMGDNGQYRKCHIQECGISHSRFLWTHPYYASDDGAYYVRDCAYWSACTNFHLIFQVFPKKGNNQSCSHLHQYYCMDLAQNIFFHLNIFAIANIIEEKRQGGIWE